MRNPENWIPIRVVLDPGTGKFVTNRRKVYGGSIHVAELQHDRYIPLIQEHIHGRVLDVGCGPVPYYEVYKPRMTENICVDWESGAHGTELLDRFVDLNDGTPLPFAESEFDSIVASDMIMYVQAPHDLLKEFFRVLKPGGRVFLSWPLTYWLSEYPHEFNHPSAAGVSYMAEQAKLKIIHMESYGGHADVLMDTLNKFASSGLSNRIFRVFASLVRATGWLERNRRRTKDRYALGYVCILQKP
ncbi:MAG: class I SAM-dependent methyltransferase [Flavobacteriales bacterium]|nr:class I SAM-dependent methyltransferase [Flavobacteriales bacterium]